MPGDSNGLARDVRLVRRRAWLFIPAFVLGLLAAFFINRVIGDANAVAELELETVVQETVIGADRGLRIFEAEAMTSDPEFIALVIAEVGDPEFDYGRYDIALQPISVADGVSRGTLTVSITDERKSEAERLRAAFVDVFIEEYTLPAPEGLFRQRFLQSRESVALTHEVGYQEAYEALQPRATELNLPLDELVRGAGSLSEEYNVQITELQRERNIIEATLDGPGGDSAAEASAILQTPVTAEAARSALQNRLAAVETALTILEEERAGISDISLEPEFRGQLDNLRALGELKLEAYTRLNDARAAVAGARSTVDVEESFSGGVAGTILGRAAVVVAVTLVGGLIAIYFVEWVSQVRAEPSARRIEPEDA
jgi:hypothetical protein